MHAGTVTDEPIPDLQSSRALTIRLERLLIFVSVVLGLLHTFAGRYSMSPDATCYLDVGSAFYKHNWFGAFNAYWSPLYAWIVGIVIGILKPSPKWEFPVAHVVNFGIFLVTLVAFRFFLRTLREFTNERLESNGRGYTLPEWVYLLTGYVVFWWCALEVTPLYELTPDLAVSACMYLAAGLMLRTRKNPTPVGFALLGLTLAIGYWTKAALFPLAILFLAITYLWNHRIQPS